MKQYIGSKIVKAEPAHRFWMPDGEKVVVPYSEDRPQKLADAVACENGYKVVYQPDGYESWSPRDVFEAAYRRTDGLSFGLALEAAKKGMRIARAGWNGKGMYVFLIDVVDLHTNADLGGLEGKNVTVRNCFAMKCADDSICPGWLASQTDMLADDWMILEETAELKGKLCKVCPDTGDVTSDWKPEGEDLEARDWAKLWGV